jgi:hypothetical protein
MIKLGLQFVNLDRSRTSIISQIISNILEGNQKSKEIQEKQLFLIQPLVKEKETKYLSFIERNMEISLNDIITK